MLSPMNTARIFLSLVLIAIFSLGSNELRISVGTILSWVVGIVGHHRLGLSSTFLRRHCGYIFVSCWLLAAYSDLFYENTAGRVLDLFFTRAFYDTETPGSGFIDWRDTILRRHRHDIAFAWRFLRFAVWSGLGFISLPFVVAFGHWYAKVTRESALVRAIEALDTTGPAEFTAWPKTERSTRRTCLDDNFTYNDFFVGCKFERKVAGDFNDSISQGRLASKQFA